MKILLNCKKLNVMEETKMKKHVSVVGGLQIGFSILWFIGALVVFFVMNFAKGFVDNDEVATKVLGFIQVSVPVFIGVIATLGIIGGVGLLAYKGWARILVIIVSALGCFNIPIGTLVGVYSIWVLMQDETVKMFDKQL
jgi:hypothetical protein